MQSRVGTAHTACSCTASLRSADSFLQTRLERHVTLPYAIALAAKHQSRKKPTAWQHPRLHRPSSFRTSRRSRRHLLLGHPAGHQTQRFFSVGTLLCATKRLGNSWRKSQHVTTKSPSSRPRATSNGTMIRMLRRTRSKPTACVTVERLQNYTHSTRSTRSSMPATMKTAPLSRTSSRTIKTLPSRSERCAA